MKLSKNFKTYEFKLVLLISTIIGVLIYFSNYSPLIILILISLSAILISLAIFSPSKIIFLSKLWKNLAKIINFIISPIIKFIIFFIIFTPYGILLRAFGRDSLLKKSTTSSWTSYYYDKEINFDKEY